VTRATHPLIAVVVAVLAACASSGGTASSEPRGDCPTAPVPIVVSVDQWGDIVRRLAGDCGDVTTVFASTSADPHDYEPTPGDTATFGHARLVVVNGLGYDPWAVKAVAMVSPKPAVVDAGKAIGRTAGANPHIWYSPDGVDRVADAVTAALRRIEPRDVDYLRRRRTAWQTSMAGYRAEIARIRAAAAGRTYGATEGVFDDMAHALGLVDVTPTGFRRAASNQSEPGPGDVNEFQKALANGKVDVLIVNTQTQGAVPDQVRRAAEHAGVPVVDVTESVPPGSRSFAAWQVDQLRRLAAALGA
jgi:zinc/manganese transport system substrate-binding protein